MKAGKVYFVAAPGRIKIGFTTQPEVRLAHLQAIDMERLEVIGTADGSRSDESALHDRLEQHRLRGEWFADNEEVRAVASLFLSGKLKFVHKERIEPQCGMFKADAEARLRVIHAGLAELRRLGDEITMRAVSREPTADLLRFMKFVAGEVVGPLLYPRGDEPAVAEEAAPEIMESK
jgi:hypothetical protein